MKLIDDKGKIFGKINFFDFLLILFLVALTPIFYFGNKALSRREVKDFKKVTVQVKFENIIPELASTLSEGDTFKNSSGNTAGVLKKIISDTPSCVISVNQLKIKNDNYLLLPAPNVKDVVCQLELNCAKERGSLSFNGYVVKIGSISY